MPVNQSVVALTTYLQLGRGQCSLQEVLALRSGGKSGAGFSAIAAGLGQNEPLPTSGAASQRISSQGTSGLKQTLLRFLDLGAAGPAFGFQVAPDQALCEASSPTRDTPG